jgi:hypothetical protein
LHTFGEIVLLLSSTKCEFFYVVFRFFGVGFGIFKAFLLQDVVEVNARQYLVNVVVWDLKFSQTRFALKQVTFSV